MAGKRPGVDIAAVITKAERDVYLVLGDDLPLPSRQADVDQLLTRLASHVEGLGRASEAGSMSGTKVAAARRLSSVPGPAGLMESRIRLVMAAEAVQELLARVRAESAFPSAAAQPRRRRHWQMFGRRLPLPPALACRARVLEESHV
ncbi:hypothetical protein [Streptomyces alanosinicus]|uniref:Uncharacterized protein n=1 Tax=Streptomyces alanosinicus TaxID=68171 RepID=A0A918YSC0_9ACTN|nr:hypothetical protein [Streptomyces alanosinicus]GHE11969.1 hypothetical protein GCM10010339_73600 [Streptomyces alanosinicus]